ncbi:Sulfite reductase [NADPH] flavoprotein alpha-component [Vibrio aerogenes CECT 7868]|uniref:Sulfite reductase [NADPH] flavoprotein alpha-component n=1 Tax=Vibrio aerogenes CECT 7868 TaxID=1216006 RepID=A0A1M5ZGZ4_9VIBR|nr:FMN-binding protein MioC [Vibrio aerogenes]SHI23555.1 Sulfite reductase [NADPH] flavoprotein alpha-component [Vibrio aerogenes CECT 7868]
MIHIITGSTLGCAEYVGDHLSDIFQEQGFDTTIHNQPDFDEIPAEDIWLIITSTHGAGDYPENIKPFLLSLEQAPPRTDKLSYAVIAIGDSSYDTFCAAGKNAYQLLEDIGATPLVECFLIDILEHTIPEDSAAEWLKENIHHFNG